MIYTCKTCKKTFDQKSNYINHLNRKNPCSIETKMSFDLKIFNCEKCGERFTALSNLSRHKKLYCKGLPINPNFNIVVHSKIYNEENDENDENDENEENEENEEKNNINEDNINENIIYNISNKKELLKNKKVQLNTELNFNDEFNLIDDVDSEHKNIIFENYTKVKDKFIHKKEEIMKKYEDDKNIIGYFYILLREEFIKANVMIYKIGITKKQTIDKRINQYPKFSLKYFQIKVKNPFIFEGFVKNLFMQKFKNELVHGKEYFSGDICEMINYVKKLYEIFHN
jgi:hypothetical protein